jgi:type III restriction enzyme
VKQYRPDFIIKLTTGDYLILETKGRNTQRDKTKKKYLEEWVKAVNQHSGFGNWSCDVSYDPSDVKDILSNVVKGKTNEKSYL